MVYYTAVVSETFFESNRDRLRQWFIDNRIPHLWPVIGRANFVDYLIFFDTEEDFLAFKLTFIK